MPNGSETPSDVALGGQPFAERLSRLLAVIADELARAANEVVTLGELLSQDSVRRDRTEAKYDLQAVDLFAQTAQVQVRLLKRLAAGETGHWEADLSALIEDVPFAQMRQRLQFAAFGQNSERIFDNSHDSEISWF